MFAIIYRVFNILQFSYNTNQIILTNFQFLKKQLFH